MTRLLAALISRRRHYIRRTSIGATIVAFGIVSGGLGVVLGVAAATPVSAAGLAIPGCAGAPVSLVPGDVGSCNATFSFNGNPGQVYLDVTTSSNSNPPGTEALLDGNGTANGVNPGYGLQITLTDATSGNGYGIGTVGCTGLYPDATPCSSADPMQPVSSGSITAGNTDVITVSWDFPIQAGNPYQGGTATINLQEEYSGTSVPPNAGGTPTPTPSASPTGGALGASTTPSPSASPSAHHGGVLGASTPTTGVGLPVVFSRVLIVLGLVLIFAGLWVWRRQRYFTRT